MQTRVLLRGFGETATVWEPLAQALAAEARVLRPVLEGVGHSGMTQAPEACLEASRDFLKNTETSGS